jgi:RNA polymerase sigma-70 factor, ECF subfamily
MTRFPTTDVNLLNRLCDIGDRQAWSDFVAIYEPLLLELLKRRGLQNSDAHEIVQETFIAITKSIHRWQHDPQLGHFRSWISRISRNLAVNYLTRHPLGAKGSGRTEEFELLLNLPDSESEIAIEFDLQMKREVLELAAKKVKQNVQQNTWSAFWLSCVEGMPVENVATQLGMSPGAVYVAKSRIVAKLKKTVEEIGFLNS